MRSRRGRPTGEPDQQARTGGRSRKQAFPEPHGPRISSRVTGVTSTANRGTVTVPFARVVTVPVFASYR